MSFLAPLLELQDLDVAADAARRRAAELPERESLPELAVKRAEIDAALAASVAERTAMQAEEERIGQEVSQIARDIETAEVERYSGKRKNQDQAAAHDASQQQLRDRQSELEDREMQLLEELEGVEARVAELQTALAANAAETERVGESIRKVDAEVGAELERLDTDRQAVIGKVPAPVVTAYERVRAQRAKGGRGAARLEDGRCAGCRIKLPSLEKTRMLAEPEDAVIQCPQCRRVLVR